MDTAAHTLEKVRDILGSDFNHCRDDPFGIVILSAASADELCRRLAPVNAIASAGHFGDLVIHIGAERVDIGAIDLCFMVKAMCREENISLGMVVKGDRDIAMGIDELFDRTGLRFAERCISTINVGAGIVIFTPADREVSIEIDTDRTITVWTAIFTPKRVVFA